MNYYPLPVKEMKGLSWNEWGQRIIEGLGHLFQLPHPQLNFKLDDHLILINWLQYSMVATKQSNWEKERRRKMYHSAQNSCQATSFVPTVGWPPPPGVVCTTALPYSLCEESTSRIRFQYKKIIYGQNWWDEDITQRGDLWELCQRMTRASLEVLKISFSPSMHHLLYLLTIV